jgi:hypothetical protein
MQIDHQVAVGTDAVPNLLDRLDDEWDSRPRIEEGTAAPAATPTARPG